MTSKETLPPVGRSFAERWREMTVYQRFESLVGAVLTVIVTCVVIVAVYRLAVGVLGGLVLGILDPLKPEVVQTVFGEIMTVLIALEFNHTLRYSVARDQSVIQTKTVLLIAILALSRRFILLDLSATDGVELFGLAALTVALGGTYWLMRERDDRPAVPAK
jgi:uncharacterized membrane protein (DUF373 family)